MKKFQLIRIAVTVGLIVTTMIQPLAVMAAGNSSRHAERVEPSACQGCGCCEVAKPSDRCCCCGGEQGSSQTTTAEPPTQTHEVSLGICLCGILVPPMDRGHRGSERVFVRQIEPNSVTAVGTSLEPTLKKSWIASAPAIALFHRFSQRFLCMWLI